MTTTDHDMANQILEGVIADPGSYADLLDSAVSPYFHVRQGELYRN